MELPYVFANTDFIIDFSFYITLYVQILVHTANDKALMGARFGRIGQLLKAVSKS